MGQSEHCTEQGWRTRSALRANNVGEGLIDLPLTNAWIPVVCIEYEISGERNGPLAKTMDSSMKPITLMDNLPLPV